MCGNYSAYIQPKQLEPAFKNAGSSLFLYFFCIFRPVCFGGKSGVFTEKSRECKYIGKPYRCGNLRHGTVALCQKQLCVLHPNVYYILLRRNSFIFNKQVIQVSVADSLHFCQFTNRKRTMKIKMNEAFRLFDITVFICIILRIMLCYDFIKIRKCLQFAHRRSSGKDFSDKIGKIDTEIIPENIVLIRYDIFLAYFVCRRTVKYDPAIFPRIPGHRVIFWNSYRLLNSGR